MLAHEVAHTDRRHVAQLLARAQAGQIATLGFSRELEMEADREALRMLVEAGFDPQAAARTLAWFNEVTGRRQENTNWAGTHPGFADRVRHFRTTQQTGPVLLRPQRLLELRDSWSLSLSVENGTDRAIALGGHGSNVAGTGRRTTGALP